MLLYPPILTDTEPSFGITDYTGFLSFSIDSTTPIFKFPLSGTHRGVPIFNTPALTFIPQIIGSDLLKMASGMISRAHGKIASFPPAFALSSWHYLTYSVNSSNR